VIAETKPKKVNGDRLTVYSGEFLVSPCATEVSFNWCSHACSFCFANLGKPDRVADLPAILNLLGNFETRKSFEALLLREGYPVLMSNRVDPFAASNWKMALPVLEVMAEKNMPVAIQTKGGKGAKEAMAMLPPSVWYISIDHNDDDAGLRIAPGAPKISQRLDLIAELKAAGHEVVVGVNPAVPEWIPRPKELLSAIASNGATGVWIERLHFNHKQEAQLNEREKLALTSEVIARAKKKKSHPIDSSFCDELTYLAVEVGLAAYTMNQGDATAYHAPFARCYPKRYPILQEFVNLCHKTLEAYSIVEFEMFWDWISPQLPEGRLPIGQYVTSKSTYIVNPAEWSDRQTFLELLSWIWCEPRAKTSPVNLFCFAYAVNEAGDYIVDEYGLPVLIFFPNGVDQYFCVIED
jgi:DNA repair photolyase